MTPGECDEHKWLMLSIQAYERITLPDYEPWDVRGCITCGWVMFRDPKRKDNWVSVAGQYDINSGVSHFAEDTHSYWRGLLLFAGKNL